MYHDISCHRPVLAYIYAYVLDIFCLFTCVDFRGGNDRGLVRRHLSLLGFLLRELYWDTLSDDNSNPSCSCFLHFAFSFTFLLFCTNVTSAITSELEYHIAYTLNKIMVVLSSKKVSSSIHLQKL